MFGGGFQLGIAQNKSRTTPRTNPLIIFDINKTIDDDDSIIIRPNPLEERNSKCNFDFNSGAFYSNQDKRRDFVIYEIPQMNSKELKTAVYTILSSMYTSPKDVITSLNDDMIQLESYAKNVSSGYVKDKDYKYDMVFNIVIQFKDGKVRYNVPNITQVYFGRSFHETSDMIKMDMSRPISTLIEGEDRKKVEKYFNTLIGVPGFFRG